MLRIMTLVAGVLFSLTANLAVAQSNSTVVELYTSQGCSSCPPADKILTRLAQRDDVIALALHVDYWDYIGWKDTFGDPSYTVRQRGYARAAGSRTIYTPQMVIGGVTHVVGNKPMDVVDGISEMQGQPSNVTLAIARNGQKLSISAKNTGNNRAMTVQVVRYIPNTSVTITRGENAGRTIEYTNIVTDWRQVKKWDGKRPLEMAVNIAGDEPVVVIVQSAGSGPILAAVELR